MRSPMAVEDTPNAARSLGAAVVTMVPSRFSMK